MRDSELDSFSERLKTLEASECEVRGAMREFDNLNRRIAALAACLDPVAFERFRDHSLAKRRQAAWREAANRVGYRSVAS